MVRIFLVQKIEIMDRNLSLEAIDLTKVCLKIIVERSTPGPSDYNAKCMQSDGVYVLSTMKGSGRRAILN